MILPECSSRIATDKRLNIWKSNNANKTVLKMQRLWMEIN